MESIGTWVKQLPGKVWLWIGGILGAIVLFAGVYLSGVGRRKGDIELEIANRELEKANKQYDDTQKKVAAIQEKKVRLVSEILQEQLRRADELKRTKGLTDAQVLEELKARGDVTNDQS